MIYSTSCKCVIALTRSLMQLVYVIAYTKGLKPLNADRSNNKIMKVRFINLKNRPAFGQVSARVNRAYGFRLVVKFYYSAIVVDQF